MREINKDPITKLKPFHRFRQRRQNERTNTDGALLSVPQARFNHYDLHASMTGDNDGPGDCKPKLPAIQLELFNLFRWKYGAF